jgi:hypothetical protein
MLELHEPIRFHFTEDSLSLHEPIRFHFTEDSLSLLSLSDIVTERDWTIHLPLREKEKGGSTAVW